MQADAFRPELIKRLINQIARIAEQEGMSTEEVLVKLTHLGVWLGRDPEGAISELARIYYVDLNELAAKQVRLPPAQEASNG